MSFELEEPSVVNENDVQLFAARCGAAGGF